MSIPTEHDCRVIADRFDIEHHGCCGSCHYAYESYDISMIEMEQQDRLYYICCKLYHKLKEVLDE